jgi:hypothetical protein
MHPGERQDARVLSDRNQLGKGGMGGVSSKRSEDNLCGGSMKCPCCGLFNPESAQRCDCGYDLQTQTVETPYFDQGRPKTIKTYITSVVIANVLFGLQIFSGGKALEIAIALIWSAIIYWLYSRLLKKDNWARIALVILTFPLGLVIGLSREAKIYCLQK